MWTNSDAFATRRSIAEYVRAWAPVGWSIHRWSLIAVPLAGRGGCQVLTTRAAGSRTDLPISVRFES